MLLLTHGFYNVRQVDRIWEYRDSRNDLKSFTSGSFPQPLIKTDKFQTCGLTVSPDERSGQLQTIGCPKRMKKQDITCLLAVLNQLVEEGNTVLVVEYHLDVIKCADWVIDLGPGGGELGGTSWRKAHRKTSPTTPNPSRENI